MNRKEAIIAMANGEKISYAEWESGYLFYDEKGVLSFRSGDGIASDAQYGLTLLEGYKIYQEPKKKEKYWKWLDPETGRVTSFVFNASGFTLDGGKKTAAYSVKLKYTEIEL